MAGLGDAAGVGDVRGCAVMGGWGGCRVWGAAVGVVRQTDGPWEWGAGRRGGDCREEQCPGAAVEMQRG